MSLGAAFYIGRPNSRSAPSALHARRLLREPLRPFRTSVVGELVAFRRQQRYPRQAWCSSASRSRPKAQDRHEVSSELETGILTSCGKFHDGPVSRHHAAAGSGGSFTERGSFTQARLRPPGPATAAVPSSAIRSSFDSGFPSVCQAVGTRVASNGPVVTAYLTTSPAHSIFAAGRYLGKDWGHGDRGYDIQAAAT